METGEVYSLYDVDRAFTNDFPFTLIKVNKEPIRVGRQEEYLKFWTRVEKVKNIR